MSSEMKWKLVPVEPTEEMIEAGREGNPTCWNEGTDYGFEEDVAVDVYASMLAAAPEPPAPAGEVSVCLGYVNIYGADADGLGSSKIYGTEQEARAHHDESAPDYMGVAMVVPASTPLTVSPDAIRRAALEEWRDARQAVFDLGAQSKVSPEQWDRLARAEHALMDIARALATRPAPDGRG